jgi:hypothetical protein
MGKAHSRLPMAPNTTSGDARANGKGTRTYAGGDKYVGEGKALLCKRQHIRWGIQGRRAKRARRFLRCEWFNQAVGHLERQRVRWSGCPLKVCGKIVENVTGSVASVNDSLLLGQSFLGRFKSWLVDNAAYALAFDE